MEFSKNSLRPFISQKWHIQIIPTAVVRERANPQVRALYVGYADSPQPLDNNYIHNSHWNAMSLLFVFFYHFGILILNEIELQSLNSV